MDASYKIQRGIHVHLIQFFMCPEFWVHIKVPKAVAEEILPESVLEQAAQDGENLCFADPVSNAIVADALLEQELVTDPQAAARLDAIRQLDDVAYDTAFEPPVSDYELDGLDLER